MDDVNQSAALKAARLAAGLPAVAGKPQVQLRRAKSDRQDRRRTPTQASAAELSGAYFDLQNRLVLKRSATVTHVQRKLVKDDISSTSIRSWSPPPPPYTRRERSSTKSTTSSGRPASEAFVLDNRIRNLPAHPLPQRQRSSSTTAPIPRPAALEREHSGTPTFDTTSSTSIAGSGSRPSSAYQSTNTSVAGTIQLGQSPLPSPGVERALNAGKYAVPARASTLPVNITQAQPPAPAPASVPQASTPPSTSESTTPVSQPSLMRRFSRRRLSSTVRKDGTSTPPQRPMSIAGSLPTTPEHVPILPPSFPSPEQMASLNRRHSGVYDNIPERSFTPVHTRARSNSAPRAASGARRYPMYPPDWQVNGGIRGSIYEVDEGPHEAVPPVPALPVELAGSSPNPPAELAGSSPKLPAELAGSSSKLPVAVPRPTTANMSRPRPKSAVVVNNAGMAEWRSQQRAPSMPITSDVLIAARTAAGAPPTQTLQIGNDVQVNKQSWDEFKERRDAATGRRPITKQARFADDVPSTAESTPANETQQMTPGQTMIIGKDHVTKKSRRKSLFGRKKDDGEKCSVM